MTLPDLPSPYAGIELPSPTFTAEQVGAAVAAAIDAHSAGDDPQAAAVAVLNAQSTSETRM